MNEKKSTAKEKLLSFTRLKGRFLAGTRLKFSDEDFAELESWDDKDCEKVVKLLRYKPIVSDGGLCPWCLVRYEYDDKQNDYVWLNNDNCDDCGFGERHGFCEDDGSDYAKFTKKYGSVLNYLGIREIEKLSACLTEED